MMKKIITFVIFLLLVCIPMLSVINAENVDIILTEDAVAGEAAPYLKSTQIAFGSGDDKVVGHGFFNYLNDSQTLRVENVTIAKSVAIGNLAFNLGNSPVYIYHQFNSAGDNRLLTATMRNMETTAAPDYPSLFRFENYLYASNGTESYRISAGFGGLFLYGPVDGARTWVNSLNIRNHSADVTSGIVNRATFDMTGNAEANVSTLAMYWASLSQTNGTVRNAIMYGFENPGISLQGFQGTFVGYYCPVITGPDDPWCFKQLGTSPSQFLGTIYSNRVNTSSYVNATFFNGDGSGLTGIVGDGSHNDSYVNKAGDVMTGALDIIHTSIEADDHTLELITNAAGFGDVKSLDIDYITGAISMGEDEGIILINIDEIEATGGDIFGIEILATEGSAEVYGVKPGVGVSPIHQDSGVFVNPTTATNNTASTDIPEMMDGNIATTTKIFREDNYYIIIGAATAFEELEFILTTEASVSIKPTFWYSTIGTGQFSQFTPVDGTNGFKNTGVVAWDQDDLTGHVADDVTGTFDIKVIRTKNTLITSPVLGYAKSASTTEYIWDKYGDLKIKNITAQNISANYLFTNNITTRSIKNKGDNWCNQTYCFELADFLLDTTGAGDGSHNSTYEAFNSTTNIQNLLNKVGLNLSYTNIDTINLSLGFTSIVKPLTNALYDLGTSSLRWLTGWFVTLDVSGHANITKNLSIIEGDLRGGVSFVTTYTDMLPTAQDNVIAIAPASWQDGTASTFVNQPVNVRNIQITVLPDIANTIKGTVTVSGVDSDNVVVQEVFTFDTAVPETQVGDNQFAYFTSIIVDAAGDSGTGAYGAGVENKIGIPNYPLGLSTDIIKVSKNGAYYISTNYAVDIVYGTIDDTNADILADDYYTIFYRPFS